MKVIEVVHIGWRHCKHVVAGLCYLFFAVMLGTCAFPILDETDLELLPNHDYIDEINKLRTESAEEAKQLAQYVFETEGMPNQDKARKIFNEIEKDQKNWWNRLCRVVRGFITGEGGSIEELGGSVTSDMFLYGDIRDLIKHGWYKVTKNEKGDAFIMTLAGVGVATEFVDVIDWAPAVLKAFRKVGALSNKMVGLLTDGIKRCTKAKKIDNGFKALLNGVCSMTDSLGFARASRVMRHADDAVDVAILAKAAKRAPNETYLLVKYAGKDGVRILEDLSDEQVKVLRVAAKKGPAVMKNVKKYGNVIKVKTSTARSWARIIKSIRSEHLTGFVEKLMLAIPFLRVVIVFLALVCCVMSVKNFWAMFKGC